MKQYFFLFILGLGILAASCDSQTKPISTDVVKNVNSATQPVNAGDLPVMDFEETVHDFGKIIQGEKVSYTFKFKNTGKSDLLISKVSTSCGCTAPNYSKEPVKPGESGKIEVTFDSHNKKGFQNKTITVLANTDPNYVTLFIKTNIEVPEQK